MSSSDPLRIPLKRPAPGYFRRFWHLVVKSGRLTTANFTDIFAEVYGDRPVFYLDRNLCFRFLTGNEVSYRQLAEVTSRIGNGLRALGVKPGDRVGLMT